MRSLQVVPTPASARARVLEQHRREETVVGASAVSLAQLEEVVAQTAPRTLRAIPSGARGIALRTILAEDSPRALGPGALRAGYRRTFEAFLNELAGGSVNPAELDRIAEQLPPWLQPRVTTVARIASAYLRFLAQLDRRDPEFALAQATRALEQTGTLPAELESIDRLQLSGVVDWTPLRLRLLRGLASALRKRGGHTVVELPHSVHPIVAETVDPIFRTLESLGDDIEVQSRPLSVPATRTAFTAATAAAEAREVARRLAALVRDGTPPGRIAIAAHKVEELAPELLSALRPLGVPARVCSGLPANQTGVWRLARDIALMSEPADVTRERVAAVIGSSLVDLRTIAPECPPPEVMIRHLRMAAVRSRASDGGREDGFQSRLVRYAASLARARNEREATLVPRTARAMHALFARLDQWPTKTTWKEHARHLLGLLTDLGVADRLRVVPTAGSSLRESVLLEHVAREHEAWTQLTSVLRDLAESVDALRLSEQSVSRDDFVEWLEHRLRETTTGAREPDGTFVELAELSELAGRQFDHVFIVGAYDGRLPEVSEPEPVFSDDERRLINDALGRPALRVAPLIHGSATVPARQLMQTLVLAMAADTATVSLTLSQPRLDARGKPLTTSPLLSIFLSDPPTHIPLVAVDPRLAARRSPSIDARREAAEERLHFFQGAHSAGRHSGQVAALAATMPVIAPGTRERPWSASALERVATCGFRFMAESVWRAKEEDEPGDQMGPLELGRLAHLAAEYAVREIVEKQLWSVKELPAALDTGIAAAARALDQEEPATVLGHPELWRVARERMLARMRRMLELEIRYTTRIGDAPIEYELPFGMRNSHLPAVEIGGVFVAGQVDRIDMGRYNVTILDYKSGRTDANARKYEEDVLLETQFQLPLYVTALSRVLPQAKHRTVDAGYISLRDGQRTIQLSEALNAKAIRDASAAVEKAVRELVARVHAGEFQIAPHSCSGCHLRPVCRIPEPEERK